MNYAELDSKIVSTLAEYGPLVFGQLDTVLQREVLAVTPAGKEPFRTLDRRLQSLRKAGKIRFVGGFGWRVVEAK